VPLYVTSLPNSALCPLTSKVSPLLTVTASNSISPIHLTINELPGVVKAPSKFKFLNSVALAAPLAKLLAPLFMSTKAAPPAFVLSPEIELDVPVPVLELDKCNTPFISNSPSISRVVSPIFTCVLPLRYQVRDESTVNLFITL